jgi:hypothetical protein
LDAIDFFKLFQDHLAPKLNTYEQAVYLYAFRHSRLIGQTEVVIGFKSARKRMALGIGKAGTPMSERQAYDTLRSLQAKGCVQLLGSERFGTRIQVILPSEIPGLIHAETAPKELDLKSIDFFTPQENRVLILQREEYKCFYCLRSLTDENYVIEHVISRPIGDNSYKNVVAACRQCNNRKGNASAEDFLRVLYRESLLSTDEFEQRLSHLQRLLSGELIPQISNVVSVSGPSIGGESVAQAGEDDSLTDELLESNPAFQAMVGRSKAGAGKPIGHAN